MPSCFYLLLNIASKQFLNREICEDILLKLEAGRHNPFRILQHKTMKSHCGCKGRREASVGVKFEHPRTKGFTNYHNLWNKHDCQTGTSVTLLVTQCGFEHTMWTLRKTSLCINPEVVILYLACRGCKEKVMQESVQHRRDAPRKIHSFIAYILADQLEGMWALEPQNKWKAGDTAHYSNMNQSF